MSSIVDTMPQWNLFSMYKENRILTDNNSRRKSTSNNNNNNSHYYNTTSENKKCWTANNHDDEDDDSFRIVQDETSLQVFLEMPGVLGHDISVSVEEEENNNNNNNGGQSCRVTIQGYRRSNHKDSDNYHSCRRLKKQRIQKQLWIDPTVVNMQRAVATMWKGVLVLYAPKRSKTIRTWYEDEDEEEEEDCTIPTPTML